MSGTWPPSRPGDPRTRQRAVLADAQSTPARFGGRAVSTHSSTCRQPPSDENPIPPATWPPYSTGASQSLHLPTRDRCPGFPALRKPSMIIPSGGPISGEAVTARYRPRKSGSRPHQPEPRTARMGAAGQPPDRCPPWCSRRLARRRRRRPPGPPTNRSRTATSGFRPLQQNLDRSLGRRPDDIGLDMPERRSAQTHWSSPAPRSTARAPTTRDPPELPTPRRPIKAPPAKSMVRSQQIHDGPKTTGGRRLSNPALSDQGPASPAGRRVSSLRWGPRRLRAI